MESHPSLMRRLIRRSWQILLLTVFVSFNLVYLIFVFVQPTYEAYSMLRVEPSAPNLFTPSSDRDNHAIGSYIQTRAHLFRSEAVLSAAVANSKISNLPSIKQSEDPKNDLRNKLAVEIVPDSYLIRVACGSESPIEAAAVVNAAVESYMAQTQRYARAVSRNLEDSLDDENRRLGERIKDVQKRLAQSVEKRNAEAAKPNLNELDKTEAMLLDHELNKLLNRQDRVKDFLAQLEFENKQEAFRMTVVDPAVVPRTPSSNNRLKFTAAAPAGVFFLVLGLFMLLEINAGRLDRAAERPSEHGDQSIT
jgi:uncharacterized protein involved in exopolysaccharide biosynthesis